MKMNAMQDNIQTSRAVRPELGTRKVALLWRWITENRGRTRRKHRQRYSSAGTRNDMKDINTSNARTILLITFYSQPKVAV